MCLRWRVFSALVARAYFLLLRQKKVAKEKATPGLAPGVARFLALLGGPGGWLNSPAAQTTPAKNSRPACVAQRRSRGPVKRPGNEAGALCQRFFIGSGGLLNRLVFVTKQMRRPKPLFPN